jgi:asparagine synthetase B (glutamine-hydrolysing)
MRMHQLHSRRGPDCSSNPCGSPGSSCLIRVPSRLRQSDGVLDSRVYLSGHVLWTQGPRPVPQPYVSQDGMRCLLFNGDIYSFTGAIDYEDSNFHPHEIHDGSLLFERLQSCIDSKDARELASLIGNIRGPFSFVYVDVIESKVWFGRDFFGRESLLFSQEYEGGTGPCNSELTHCSWNISSVSVFKKVFEIPTAGVFKMDLVSKSVEIIPYFCSHKRLDVLDNLARFGKFLETVGIKSSFDFANSEIPIRISLSTTLRTSNPQDSLVLKQLLDLGKMTELHPSEMLIRAAEILDNQVNALLIHLRRSVKLRMKAVSPTCRNCVYNSASSTSSCKNHSTVGILFSGGLDSTVLAYLVAEQSTNKDKPFELINVAFAKDGKNYDACPDRQTGIESFEVLRRIFEPQGKHFTLVLVNETKEEVEKMRQERIRDLISPLTSVLDDSLGCCLWFATRGRGNSRESQLPSVTLREDSSVKTVFLGSGADELFGGYGRHRSAFERGGWDQLAQEMQLDLDRISIRNMGRDNRVVSDHGVCPRLPFLDEGVLNFVTQECDLWVKCCPVLGDRGLGEKLLLRAAALKLFGKENAKIVLFPKRAMQFGSRIAKLENSKEKGGDCCDRLIGF